MTIGFLAWGQKLKYVGVVDPNLPEKVAEIINNERKVWGLARIENWISEKRKTIEVIPISDFEGMMF